MPQEGETGKSDGAMTPRTEPALHWLRTNENLFGFASNYFGKTGHAADFVEALYAIGGIKDVRVTGILDEPERLRVEGGPIADTLIVTLEDVEDEHTKAILRHLKVDELDEIEPGVFRMWWD